MSSIKFPFGRYKDRYVCHIVQTDPHYVVWFFENVEGAEKWVTEAHYQGAHQNAEDFDDWRRDLEGIGCGPEWWKD